MYVHIVDIPPKPGFGLATRCTQPPKRDGQYRMVLLENSNYTRICFSMKYAIICICTTLHCNYCLFPRAETFLPLPLEVNNVDIKIELLPTIR